MPLDPSQLQTLEQILSNDSTLRERLLNADDPGELKQLLAQAARRQAVEVSDEQLEAICGGTTNGPQPISGETMELLDQIKAKLVRASRQGTPLESPIKPPPKRF